ncbi:MAG: polymer-forming cytoskeletal protein [Acidobacteriota bacterium]|nr:MAG: polymer-forming cytoskeletal protein [Acidobacteriota bacterium]
MRISPRMSRPIASSMATKMAIAALLMGSAGTALAGPVHGVFRGRDVHLYSLGGLHTAAGDRLEIGSGELIEGDVYAAFSEVSTDGTIDGDLFVATGQARLGGFVREDLAVGAADVQLGGKVGGDVRAFTGQLRIDASIGGDLVHIGGALRLEQDSQVEGTVLSKAGQADLLGLIDGPLNIGGGRVYIDGTIRGDAFVECDQFSVGPNARFEGDLTYRARNEVELAEGVVAGTVSKTIRTSGRDVDFDDGLPAGPAAVVSGAWRAFQFLLALYLALVALVAGLLLWLFFRPLVEGSLQRASGATSLGVSFGIGLVALFAMLVLGLLCLLLFPLAFAIWSALGALLYFGGLIGKMILGRFVLWPLLRRAAHPLLALLVGVVLMLLISMVPLLGNLIWMLVTVTGIGAVLLQLRGQQLAPLAVEPTAPAVTAPA